MDTSRAAEKSLLDQLRESGSDETDAQGELGFAPCTLGRFGGEGIGKATELQDHRANGIEETIELGFPEETFSVASVYTAVETN
jgi:hypothetical protein